MKKQITEGNAKLIIDEIDQGKVISKELEAFYNPKMKLNRDFSIAILKILTNKKNHISLPLAGTGVRAVRMMQEIPQLIEKIYVNDLNEKAIEFVKENFKINNIPIDEKVQITCLDGNKFITDSFGFDYIDIDPFGSPNFLLDTAIRNIARNGIIGVSATDTGALAGTYPDVCRRKYLANSIICPQKHELGIRILIRKVQIIGLHNEKYLEPLFTYHYEHYYRIYFRVHKSKEKANQAFEKINTYHYHCKKCSYHFVHENKNEKCPKCENKIIPSGPMYCGKLNDEKIIEKLMQDKTLDKEGIKILEKIKEELPLQEQVGYYDTHNICYNHKFRSSSIKEIKEKLIGKKYRVYVSATNPLGIKTDAPYEEILKALTKKEKDIK